MKKIELNGMRFHACHGCFAEEKVKGGEFVVDFCAEYDFGKAGITDCIDDTLDYGPVYKIVAEEMAQTSNLIENVATRIVDRISESYPAIDCFTVKVTKMSPPVGGPCDSASVTIEHKKQV